MDLEQSAVAWTRALLGLSAQSGERFPEEWKLVQRRLEVVHGAAIPRETEPAVALPGLLVDRAHVSARGAGG